MEQVVAKLREMQRLQGQGLTIPQAQLFKAFEQESSRLKRIVAERRSSSDTTDLKQRSLDRAVAAGRRVLSREITTFTPRFTPKGVLPKLGDRERIATQPKGCAVIHSVPPRQIPS